MNLFFLNPWGLLALLGIPAVLMIHLLRRKSRTVTASTLFLVADVLKSREGGQRIQTLRTTLPLWIQLAAVIVLSIVLAGPRWVNPASSLKVVVVMDDSASMTAFREEALLAVDQVIASAAGVAGNVEFRVLGSDAVPLLTGTSASEVREALSKAWNPTRGAHDFSEALTLARRLAGAQGVVTLITDHSSQGAELPEGVDWIACGSPDDNAAFLSGTVEGNRWTAILRDFSKTPGETLRWRVAGSDAWTETPVSQDGIAEISGDFPADSPTLTLELPPDALLIDNLLPLVIPVQKPLHIQAATGELFDRLLRLAEPVAPGEPDLVLGEYDPLDPAWPKESAILFLKDPAKSLKLLPGEPVADNDPLMDDLDWRGLLARDSLQVPLRETDVVLLWQGPRPLIFLRPNDAAPQLVFNFDVTASQATRLPAFALLVHRFVEERRQGKSAYAAANVTTGERLPLPGDEPLYAPRTPRLFRHTNPEGTLLFDGAAQFGDPRESDLRKADSAQSPTPIYQAQRTTNAEGRFLDVLGALLLAGLILWNWWLTGTVPHNKNVRSLKPATGSG
ncbi:MAG: BatA domain-containing protein [Terrimicrobiaceae bacterium]